MHLRISIIIPVYNVEKYLRQCIDSVLRSTFIDYELLLVDDGSTDKSGRICDDYAEKDSRIRVFHQENGGVSKARNLGIDNAKALWITFIDADDWVSETFLENLYKAVVEHSDVDLVICGYTNYKENEIGDVEQSYSPYYGSDTDLLCPIYRGRPYGKLFKRDLLQNVKFDESTACTEDLLFITDYLIGVKVFALLEEVGYYYRSDNENSIMHSGKRIDYPEALHIFLHLYEGVTNLVSIHHIDEKIARLRFQQVADAMAMAISRLYDNGVFSREERLMHLRDDFTKEQLRCLKYANGRRNQLVFFFLRHRWYNLFDYMKCQFL